MPSCKDSKMRDWLIHLLDFFTYEFLKEFHIAIVGLIGFTGVIITHVLIAYFNQKCIDREHLRKRNAVKAVLLAELQILHKALDDASASLDQLKEETFDISKIDRRFSKSLLPDFVILEAKVLYPTVFAMLALDKLEGSLSDVAENESMFYFSIKSKNVGQAQEIIKSVLPEVDKAIKLLSPKFPWYHRANA